MSSTFGLVKDKSFWKITQAFSIEWLLLVYLHKKSFIPYKLICEHNDPDLWFTYIIWKYKKNSTLFVEKYCCCCQKLFMLHSVHTQLAEGPFHTKDFRIILWFPRPFGLVSLEFCLFLQPTKLGFHGTNQVIWWKKKSQIQSRIFKYTWFQMKKLTIVIFESAIGTSIFFWQDIFSNGIMENGEVSSAMNIEPFLHFVVQQWPEKCHEVLHDSWDVDHIHGFRSNWISILGTRQVYSKGFWQFRKDFLKW